MKNIKIMGGTMLVALLFAISCTPQQTKSDKMLKEALPQLDKSAGNFDPSSEVKAESAHRALTIVVSNDGTYKLDSVSLNAPVRKGRLPYKIDREEPKGGLPFAVSWYDRANSRLGSYTIESPLLLRSCEDGKQEIKVVSAGSFELLLPANVDIGNVRITDAGKEVATFQLPARRQ